jgi:hypothetical protein
VLHSWHGSIFFQNITVLKRLHEQATYMYFAEHISFGLIINKQEYNELNLIISYIALLVSNGDWKPPRMGTYSAN